MSAQSQPVQSIPLNRLLVSSDNVRRTDRKADIEALAASIASHGLLQNLSVTAADNDRFAVVAGGRRLAALKSLAKAGVIAKDFPVPCKVVAVEAGREASLVENVHRVAMDPIDEVEAFAALLAEGSTNDQIAHRFGVTIRHVDQRLVLAGLSPKIKSAWKRGQVSLEAARAFCLVEDHAQQEAVFRSLGKPVTHAASVRARLMEGRMRASDRLAKFVGLEGYELAGGAVVRDLFDVDAVYVEDPSLMARLAEEKLHGDGQAYLELGWGWVEVNLGQGRIEGASGTRLQPEWRELDPKEQAEMDRLKGELHALDEALDQDSVEDDPRWETRDDLAAAIEALRQSARDWDKELKPLAGVVLSIDHDGRVHSAFGVVRQADEKTIRAIRKRRQTAETGESGSVEATSDLAKTPGEESGLPKGVIRDLSLARTRAIRLTLARDPDKALAVAVAAMIVRTHFRSDLAGVSVAAHPAVVDDLDALEETRGMLEAVLPAEESDVLGWCLGQSTDALLFALAVLVARSVDLAHEKGSPADRRRHALADKLAAALRLDMREHWTSDAAFWTRLPKAELLATLADAPSIADLPDGERQTMLKAHAKLKKDDLAARVGEVFDGTGYLPDLLVTSLEEGALEITMAGDEAVAA
ncbi:MAG: ParB/RepB/Spo0J family partition protein [Hyphomonadaceae bacterium]|nr:ParB/RepB/Spo0J family partition protein [Hyphomonadaceae bacterium]